MVASSVSQEAAGLQSKRSVTRQNYSFEPTEEYGLRYEYIATMSRGGKVAKAQDGAFFCDSDVNAETVIAYWNFISEQHRTNGEGDVVWAYTLKGKP